MPMIDATIPEGALEPAAERALLKRLTDILIHAEGYDPADERVQSVTVLWLHRPAALYVAGQPAEAPRYRIVCSVPEGQYDDEKRARLVAAVTEAVLDAEAGKHPRSGARVWVFPTEIREGTWGSRGRIQRLADIRAFLAGER